MELHINDVVEFRDDPDRWGIVKSFSDDGKCAYLQRFGKGAENTIGYSGVHIDLLQRPAHREGEVS